MTKVKICGLTRPEDITAVNQTLPDYIGFVFAPSKRKLTPQAASALKEKLDPSIKIVGVFVNESIEVITEIQKTGIIDMVQLHGEEDDEYITKLKTICKCQVIKSIGIKSTKNTKSIIEPTLVDLPKIADYLLFDTLSPQRGGTGEPFDWQILKSHKGLPYFLAGGLRPENVKEAITLLDPYSVDVSSGVETNAVKDAIKIEEFIQIVRETRR